MSTADSADVPDRSTGTGSANAVAMVDDAFVLVLGALGLYGFRTLYGGWQYLLIGVVGLLLGIGIVEIAVRWKKPVLAEALVAVVIFLVAGGAVAARDTSLGGVIPTGATLAHLWHVSLFGWKELLTTAPPVGNSSNLLAIPYLVGLVGGVAGTSLARRTRRIALPVLGPAAVLAVGILFGARFPTSLLLQGTMFGGVALIWVVVRYHRFRPVVAGTGVGPRRMVTGGVVLLGVMLVAGVMGPYLPGAGSHERVVLSRYVVPPFDVNDQPSPLAGFRQYAKGGELNQSVLFVIHGAGGFHPDHVRIATMDAYNGLVWGFGANGAGTTTISTDDTFQKFGTVIPAGTPGSSHTITIRSQDLSGVWLPEVGNATRITFAGAHSGQLGADVRYDTATSTAAQPDGLQPGSTYSMDVVVPKSPTAGQLKVAPAGATQLDIADVPAAIRTDAVQWEGNATSAWGKVSNIAAHLKSTGKYSDGSSATGDGPPLSLPGHGAGRLTTFLDGGGVVGTQIVGDDEQYAAAMALMAAAVNVPARVVMGAVVPPDGSVTGGDVHAWIEVDLGGLGWVPMYQDQFMSNTAPNQTPPSQQPQAQVEAPIQPPAISAVRSPFDDQLPGMTSSATSPDQGGNPLIPAWVWSVVKWVVLPLAFVAAVAGAILGVKRRRRNRRYRAATPSARITGAWAELLDGERDLGREIPGKVTRREQVPHLRLDTAEALATRADAAVFGPGDPTDEEIDEFWGLVDRSLATAKSGLTRLQRWRATLSLRSLRVGRHVRAA